MAALNEAINEATAAADATVTCSGGTSFVITPKALKPGEYVVLYGEDPTGTFTEEIYRFTHLTKPSVVIVTYREVFVDKTATVTAVGVNTSGTVS